jgi:hypothetical protein
LVFGLIPDFGEKERDHRPVERHPFTAVPLREQADMSGSADLLSDTTAEL